MNNERYYFLAGGSGNQTVPFDQSYFQTDHAGIPDTAYDLLSIIDTDVSLGIRDILIISPREICRYSRNYSELVSSLDSI